MIKRSGYVLQAYFVVSGILFLSACLYFATDNVFLSRFIPVPERKYNVIGYIRSVDGDTRVRSAGELLWVPGRPKEPIRDHDSIFTGPNGRMNILIEPGTTLVVNKDSLFKVNRKDHLTTVQVIQGDLTSSSDRAEKIKIQAKNKSQMVNLTEVEKKVSFENFNDENHPPVLTLPSSEDLREALQDDHHEDYQPSDPSKGHANVYASVPLSETENTPSLPINEVKGFAEESNKQILWIMGAAYLIFSLIALSELLRPSKT